MSTAQNLYEGIDINGETTGLITYMRTDGVNIADEAITNARDVIGSKYGDIMFRANQSFTKTNQRMLKKLMKRFAQRPCPVYQDRC